MKTIWRSECQAESQQVQRPWGRDGLGGAQHGMQQAAPLKVGAVTGMDILGARSPRHVYPSTRMGHLDFIINTVRHLIYS